MKFKKYPKSGISWPEVWGMRYGVWVWLSAISYQPSALVAYNFDFQADFRIQPSPLHPYLIKGVFTVNV